MFAGDATLNSPDTKSCASGVSGKPSEKYYVAKRFSRDLEGEARVFERLSMRRLKESIKMYDLPDVVNHATI